ncbi:MAG TPA: YebC/PmpR family DNA-binding transcriptional regulator [Alphaproteobacteria bacterium]|jgi:YebC/PmpR family DNA-binding regulatory protein
MAGHSQFKNIMHRKGAQDAKKAKVFTKIIRELTVAARSNSDPSGNPRLRAAIIAARDANMPKDTVDRAIKRGAGGEDQTNYEEMRYEGYGPGGVAVIVEALTDNRNRTAGEVRTAFSKAGGALGETNSVSFMFERIGNVFYPASSASSDAMFEAALEAGARDVESTDEGHDVVCAPDDFAGMAVAMEKKFGAPDRSGIIWRPQTTAPVDRDAAEAVLKLIDVLDENDDVRAVYVNFEVSDEVMSQLSA